MKANELMIGDWVQDIGPVLIDAISNEDVVTYQSTNGYNVTANPSNLKPIPLTPEILEKNGFEKKLPSIGNAPFYTFSDDDEYYALAIDEYTDSLWRIEYTNCEINFPLVRIMVSFVHELQHALRLCGIEKEIVL